MPVTFETKMKDQSTHPALEAIADHMSHVEQHLFVDRYVHGKPLLALKREYIIKFGITARQFNATSRQLLGKVRSSRKATGQQRRRLTERIFYLHGYLKKLERRIAKEKRLDRRKKLCFQLHQKKRHLHILEQRLNSLRGRVSRPVPRVCFGGRKMFRKQFHLQANGYRDHAEWLLDYWAARSSQFLCLGSGDEKRGNQTATLLPGGILRLRVPPALEGQYGKWILIREVRFPYGQEVIDFALKTGQPITFRFVRRKRKGKWVWYVQATTERHAVPIITRREFGAVGADFNPDVVAAVRIDRCGNPTASRHFPAGLEGKSREQREALLAEIVADIVALAKREGVPVVIEKLDFEKEKARLRKMDSRPADKLSRYDSRRFHHLMISRAAREGVEVIEVEPDYTTVIGWTKFGPGYHLSVHAAAAVAIARRGLGFGEAPRSRICPGGREGSASPLPVRNRGEHVLSTWGRLCRGLRARTVRGRRPTPGGRMRGIPLSAAAPPRTREGSLRDGSPSGSGERKPPAQKVGSAVRPAS